MTGAGHSAPASDVDLLSAGRHHEVTGYPERARVLPSARGLPHRRAVGEAANRAVVVEIVRVVDRRRGAARLQPGEWASLEVDGPRVARAREQDARLSEPRARAARESA